jgi:hypothetical protein
MEIGKKVKLALDESRMLVLGAQVLIGFQFRSVFQEAFDSLPPWSRYLDGVALLLMVCALGLLILPGPYHRMVEEGKNSGRLQSLIGVVASWALAPFGLSIGLAVAITCERVWGPAGGLLLEQEHVSPHLAFGTDLASTASQQKETRSVP